MLIDRSLVLAIVTKIKLHRPSVTFLWPWVVERKPVVLIPDPTAGQGVYRGQRASD